VRAGLAYALEEAESTNGHCGLPKPELQRLAAKLLEVEIGLLKKPLLAMGAPRLAQI
jgi:hypothetical protein